MNRIKQLRKKAGLTQERLALLSLLDQSYISLIERGMANPSIVVRQAIATTLRRKLKDKSITVERVFG